jgi:hypothetical protein
VAVFFPVADFPAVLRAAVFRPAVAAVLFAAVLREPVFAAAVLVAVFAGSDWSSTTSVVAFFCTDLSADTAARLVS